MEFTIEEAKSYIQFHDLPVRFGYKANILWNVVNDKASIANVVELPCGGYNSGIDFDIYSVLKYLSNDDNNNYVTYIAKDLNLDEKYVELIQYIICGADLCDYGGSPRGCFLTPYGELIMKYLNRKTWKT